MLNLRCTKISVQNWPHTARIQRVRVVKDMSSLRAYGVTIEKALYKQRPERRQELLLDIDKPFNAIHVHI